LQLVIIDLTAPEYKSAALLQEDHFRSDLNIKNCKMPCNNAKIFFFFASKVRA
jgi:hypothetical protein